MKLLQIKYSNKSYYNIEIIFNYRFFIYNIRYSFILYIYTILSNITKFIN